MPSGKRPSRCCCAFTTPSFVTISYLHKRHHRLGYCTTQAARWPDQGQQQDEARQDLRLRLKSRVDSTLPHACVTRGAPDKAILAVEAGNGLLLAAAMGCWDPGGPPALQLALDGTLCRQLIDDGRDDL